MNKVDCFLVVRTIKSMICVEALADLVNTWLYLYQVLKDGLATVHVPYAYGFAIILLTVLVKIATFPLTKKQVNCCVCNYWNYKHVFCCRSDRPRLIYFLIFLEIELLYFHVWFITCSCISSFCMIIFFW